MIIPLFEALSKPDVNLIDVKLSKGSVIFLFKDKNALNYIPRDIPFCYYFSLDDVLTLTISIHDFFRYLKRYFYASKKNKVASNQD